MNPMGQAGSETAETYTHGHHESVLRSHEWRTAENSAGYLLDRLEPGMDLLDVGCGPGTITIDLARRVAPGRVVGIDSAADAVEATRAAAVEAQVTGLEVRVDDVYGLDADDASFDVVHAHQVLQHLTDPVAALREMRRVLERGGRAAISVWQALDQNPVMQAVNEVIARNFNKPVSTIAQAFSCGDRDEVAAWLVSAGFQQIEIYPVTHPVRFKDTPRFIKLLLQERAAIPVYAQVNTSFIRTIHQKIAYEIAWLLQQYTSDNILSFNMSANIFIAHT
jgi:ubiquinone/menaquinone biosynthesis C-methylase UbiE